MKRLLRIFLIFLLPCSAFAEISVSLKLNRIEAELVDSIKMSVSISGSRDAEAPEIKGLENFHVQTGGQSSRIEIINGKFSSNLDFTYFLQPKNIGTFEIGPASVKIDGKIYKSDSVKLTVKKHTDRKENTDIPVFLTATLSSKTAYIEEQLSFILRLYYIPDISNLSLAMPENEGLSFKQIGKPVEYTTEYKSRNYRVIEIRYSLLPSITGRFEINPARMSMIIRSSRGRDEFEDFFSTDDFFSRIRGKSVTIASNSPVLTVLALPEAGKPADYTGLIGRFQITAVLDPQRLKAGESSTLTVVLKGTGNINRIPDIKIPDMDNLKIYSDEPSIETQQTDRGLLGIKTMKWAIVPEKEGLYNIPALTMSYFDSAKRAFLTKSTRPFKLVVDPGTGEITEPEFAKARADRLKEPVEELGKDILPIHKSVKNLSKPASFSILWILWLIIPAFLFALILTIIGIKKPTPEKEARQNALRATKEFFKKCKDKDLTANDLSNAVRDYFNNRFYLQLGSIAPDDAVDILKSGGCKKDTINETEWMLKKLETLIYTGKGSEPSDLTDEAALIIKSIEKEIK